MARRIMLISFLEMEAAMQSFPTGLEEVGVRLVLSRMVVWPWRLSFMSCFMLLVLSMNRVGLTETASSQWCGATLWYVNLQTQKPCNNFLFSSGRWWGTILQGCLGRDRSCYLACRVWWYKCSWWDRLLNLLLRVDCRCLRLWLWLHFCNALQTQLVGKIPKHFKS